MKRWSSDRPAKNVGISTTLSRAGDNGPYVRYATWHGVIVAPVDRRQLPKEAVRGGGMTDDCATRAPAPNAVGISASATDFRTRRPASASLIAANMGLTSVR